MSSKEKKKQSKQTHEQTEAEIAETVESIKKKWGSMLTQLWVDIRLNSDVWLEGVWVGTLTYNQEKENLLFKIFASRLENKTVGRGPSISRYFVRLRYLYLSGFNRCE